MKTNKSLNRILSILLCLCMVAQYVPTVAFAADAGDTTPAQITGVSITVDGTEYTGGNVTVKPDSTVIINVTGSNLGNGTEDHAIVYSAEYHTPVTSDYFAFNANGTSGTQSLQASDFDGSAEHEIVYSNDYLSDDCTYHGTGIYVTYAANESAPACSCEIKCSEGRVNSACDVCSADLSDCTGADGTDPDAGTVTLYFKNTANWGTVYAYYWGGSRGVTWPGVAMTDLGNGILSIAVPSDEVNIIFNNGIGSQTADLTIPTDGNNCYDHSTGTWINYVPGIQPGYYLVGILNGENKWSVDSNASTRLLQEDPNTEGQYYLDYTVAPYDEIKIAYFDGVSITKLFRTDGEDSYSIGEHKAGHVRVLFMPDGNDMWSYLYFTLVPVYDITVIAAENGAVTADKECAIYDEIVNLTAVPEDGCLFDTWIVTNANGSSVTVENNSFTMPASDVTVTAVFKEISCSCEIKCSEGRVNSACDVCSADLLGCVAEECTHTSHTDGVCDACGAVQTFTIIFQTDGGTEIAPIKGAYGSVVTAPADPVKTGYTFAGWDKQIPTTMPDGNMTITAQWTVNRYKLTLNAGEGAFADGSKEMTFDVDFGTSLSDLETPVLTGYTFAGWDPALSATMPAENVTATAMFKALPPVIEAEYKTEAEQHLIEWTANIPAGLDRTLTSVTVNGYELLDEQNTTAKNASVEILYGGKYTFVVTDSAGNTASMELDVVIPVTFPADSITVVNNWSNNSLYHRGEAIIDTSMLSGGTYDPDKTTENGVALAPTDYVGGYGYFQMVVNGEPEDFDMEENIIPWIQDIIWRDITYYSTVGALKTANHIIIIQSLFDETNPDLIAWQFITVKDGRIRITSISADTLGSTNPNGRITAAFADGHTGEYEVAVLMGDSLAAADFKNSDVQWQAAGDDGTIALEGLTKGTYQIAVRAKYDEPDAYKSSNDNCWHGLVISAPIEVNNAYTVTYDLNGGEGTAPAADKQYVDTAFTVASNDGFSRTGYAFLGWAFSADATAAEYTEGTIISSITTDTKLYAVWQKCDHSGNTNEITDRGNGKHGITCSVCEETITDDHTFDTATGKCNLCGADMTVVATVTDGTNTYYAADAETLNQAVTKILADGGRTFAVNFPGEPEAKLFTAIRRALIDTEGVAAGSVNLTLSGVEVIPDHSSVAIGDSNIIFGDTSGNEIESVTQLASVSLPDVLTIGNFAFSNCRYLTSLSAPKLQTLGINAFAFTGLTSVDLPEATTIGSGAFVGCMSLTSVKLPKATSLANQVFLMGTSHPESFDLELTAEGDVTIGEKVFGIPKQNYSDKVDLVLHSNKADEVTDGATWNGYTFRSIRFICTDGTLNHSFTYKSNGDDTHKKSCERCGLVEAARETHFLALTYVNLEADGHKAYYPCCQKEADVEAQEHTYKSGICACEDVEEFILSFYAEEGDETPVATFSVPYGTELLVYSYDEEMDEETFLGATDYLKDLISQINTSSLTKAHYTFAGWDVENGPSKIVSDKSIYGSWKPVSYKVTWDLAGGYAEYPEELDSEMPYNEYFMLWTDFYKEGHTFSHFVDQNGLKYTREWRSDHWSIDQPMPGHDLTLTAVWDANAYTLRVQDQSKDVDYGTALTDALSGITPEKTGYTFTGWKFYLDEGCTEEYTGNTMPAYDLYAQPVFEAIEYNITWDMSGCTYELSNFSELPTKLEYCVDAWYPFYQVNFYEITPPEGYTFVGFADGNGNELEMNNTDIYRLCLTVSGDMTVKAVIEPKPYTAIWETGDGGSYEKEFKFGETITIPTDEFFADTFRKAGYTLVGWDGYTEGMTMPVGGVTITAKWQINEASLSATSGKYTGKAHAPAVTVAGLTEGTDFTVTYPADMTNAGEKTITVTGKLGGTVTVTYTIEKADAPQITFPKVLNAITYGQEIADAKLSFYENEYGSFNWTAPIGVPNAGIGDYALDFYPSDLKNYDWEACNWQSHGASWIESRNALCAMGQVIVNKAPVTHIGADLDVPYDGNPIDLRTMFQLDPNAGEASWWMVSMDGHGSFADAPWSYMILKTGTFTVEVRTVETENYAAGSATAKLTVRKGKGTGTVTMEDWTYGETAKTAVAETQTNGAVTFLYTGGNYSNDVVPTDAGTYTVIATFAATDLYEEATATDTFVIAKKSVTVRADAQTKTYGEADPMLTYKAEGLVNGDALTGALTREEGNDVGIYKITQGTLTAGSNYSIDYTGAELTINPKPVDGSQISLAAVNLPYTGKPQTVQLTVPEGITYEVAEDSLTETDVGNYELTIRFVGNYTGMVTLGWQITKVAPDYTAPAPKDLTYTGEAQALVNAGITADGVMMYSLTENGEYSETIPTGTGAGDYMVWYYVKGDRNHTDTAKTSVQVKLSKAEQTIMLTDPVTEGKCGAAVKLPQTVAQGTVTFDSSDPAVAKITDDGITAVTAGTVTITVTAAETDNYRKAEKTYTLTVSHTPASNWDSDGENHWHSCVCGYKAELSAHIPGTAICTEDQLCTVCERVLREKTEHSYGDWAVTREATCAAMGEERRECRNCDAYENRSIAAKDHTYDNPMDSICNGCGERRAVYVETTPMYRLYNPNTGEHFYTGSTVERDNLVAVGWSYEGVAWNAPVEYGDPVYRMYNPVSGDHHFTMSRKEVEDLQEAGWNYEGVAWNSASSDHLPIYRLYNPNAEIGAHHFTGSAEERDNLVAVGWKYEGIGWYGPLY